MLIKFILCPVACMLACVAISEVGGDWLHASEATDVATDGSASAPCAVAKPSTSKSPYTAEKGVYSCDALVVGGSSAGVAAALTAGRLGLEVVYVVRAPHDVAGLLGVCLNIDSDLPARRLGGLPVELDTLARVKSGVDFSKLANHGSGFNAPPQVYFRYLKSQLEALPNVTIVGDYYPIAVEKAASSPRIRAVRFRHRKHADREIEVRPRVTIDAEAEGDVMALAGVSWTLRREAKQADAVPSRNEESYAGRVFMSRTHRDQITIENAVLEESTHEADREDRTMGWNAVLILKMYPPARSGPESPWILKKPPRGYDAMDREQMTRFTGITLGQNHYRSIPHRELSFIEGWKMPDGRHVLRSMEIEDRERNEKKHLAYALGALYRLQHVEGKYHVGLSDETYREGLPAKYTLADFDTETHGGDAPLPSQIYLREGRRMVNDHVFGGKLIEDDGGGQHVQRRPPHARAAYFNAMLIDIHAVTREQARHARSHFEGYMLLRLAGLDNFGTPPIPFDTMIPRASEAENLLVAAAGAYTHQAYSAFPRMEPGRLLQGQACAALAYHAVRDDLPAHRASIIKAQLTLLDRFGQSLHYRPDSFAHTRQHTVDQMLATHGVPAFDAQTPFAEEHRITSAQALEHLKTLQLPITNTEPVAPDEPVSWHAALRWLGIEAEPPAGNIGLLAWKRLLFNAAFAENYDVAAMPVNLAPRLAWDTFSRAKGPLKETESRIPYKLQGAWYVDEGCLIAEDSGAVRFATMEAPSENLVLACDLYLEQLQTGAAGVVLRDPSSQQSLRCFIQADGDCVSACMEGALINSETPQKVALATNGMRGFHLELRVRDGRGAFYIDGQQKISASIDTLPQTCEAGVVNGAGVSSRFDNLELHRGVIPCPPGGAQPNSTER